MGRKRKRPRKIEPSAERVDLEPADEDVDGEDSTTRNPPMAEPSAAGEREEVSEVQDAEEDIGKLLEPFTRDELLNILTDACLRDPALLSRLAASAASDAAHRSDVRRALADSSKRVDGRPVASQLASLGPVPQSFSDRKLFVDNVPERAAHGDLRGLFSRFGEIEEGPLGADRATGLFRGHAMFLYRTPEGLSKALEEPTKVFDGCQLQCRRAHKVSHRNNAAAAPPDTVAAALPAVQPMDSGLASKQSPVSSNPPIRLTSKGSSSAKATVLLRQSVPAGGAGILGASPVATATMALTSLQRTPSTPPTHCEDAIGDVGLGNTARAGTPPMVPAVGANNSPSSLQVLGAANDTLPFSSGTLTSASRNGQRSTRPGLIQYYLGR